MSNDPPRTVSRLVFITCEENRIDGYLPPASEMIAVVRSTLQHSIKANAGWHVTAVDPVAFNHQRNDMSARQS